MLFLKLIFINYIYILVLMKSSEKSNAKITSIRIVLVGDGNVGKTSILVRYLIIE
jgi:GTPase SAR1 family protein